MIACACLGPRPGDPYCPCGMKSRGLKSIHPETPVSPEAIKNLQRFFAENVKRAKAHGGVVITQ